MDDKGSFHQTAWTSLCHDNESWLCVDTWLEGQLPPKGSPFLTEHQRELVRKGDHGLNHGIPKPKSNMKPCSLSFYSLAGDSRAHWNLRAIKVGKRASC